MNHRGPTSGESRQPAEILAPAPVLALAAFAVGAGAHLLWPVGVLPGPWNLAGGAALVVIGAALLASALRAMRRVGKSPAHGDEPPELVTDGPFRYTRNPLYLGVCVVYVGATLLLDSLWPVGPLAVLVWYFDRVARREEAYLEAAFGDEFARYRENVRRWF